LLEISGKDREAFLQGQCTNDVLRLEPGGVMQAAALTSKGKLLDDFRVARRENLRILAAPGRSDSLAAHLRKYAVFQDVQIDARGGFSIVELFGPVGMLPEPRPGLVSDAAFAGAAIEIWPPFFETNAAWIVPAESAPAVEDALSGTATRIPDEEAEALRIEAGRPEYGKDMDDTNLPDEIGMDDAISTTKGCYVGQEIVARLRTYGRVNKRLVGFSFSPRWLPPPGSVLVRRGHTEKELGRVTSAALSARFGAIGLGYAVRDVEEGDELCFREDETKTARIEPKARL
jgi:folate-binding protein YgfZ